MLEPQPPAAPLPIDWQTPRFEVVHVSRAEDVPAPRAGAIDVGLLDMNHGYANVGHDAIVAYLRDLTADLDGDLAERGRSVRVLSYPVRDRLMVPDHAAGRHALYVGTGGPGHLDPRCNLSDEGTREIREDPAWEAPLWRLFEAIRADRTAALYGVCHTFGLLCRWSGAAHPVLRTAAQGGALSGVGNDILTAQGREHPWFAQLLQTLPSGVLPVLESRHYDLIPGSAEFPAGVVPIANACTSNGVPGEALTMLELARDDDGTPRVFAVNSHPEIGTPERVQGLLERLLLRGQISAEVYRERSALLPVLRDDRRAERLLVARVVFGDLIARRLAALVRAA